MLYEVAILEKPTPEQAKEGLAERLVLGPVAVVAGDERNAAIAVVMDHAAVVSGAAKDRLEVLVRPFAK